MMSVETADERGDYVLYRPGMPGSSELEELRKALPLLWLPHDVIVEIQETDYATADPGCATMAQQTATRLAEVAEMGYRGSLLGDSGAVRINLLVAAWYPHLIHRLVNISGKITMPYDLPDKTRQRLPVLAESSDILPGELHKIHYSTRQRTLCVYGEEDEEIDPSTSLLEGAQSFELPACGHEIIIAHALSTTNQEIREFIQQD